MKGVSQGVETIGLGSAWASAVTRPRRGCVGSSGSTRIGTSRRGSAVAALATTTTSIPASANAVSGYEISGRPPSSTIALRPTEPRRGTTGQHHPERCRTTIHGRDATAL